METNELIRQLSQKATPVERLAPVPQRFLRWLVAALLCLFVSISILGVREDLYERLTDTRFLSQSLVLFLLGVISALSAFVLSIPDDSRGRLWDILPYGVLMAWIALSIWTALSPDGPVLIDFGGMCAFDILLVAVPPGLLLLFMVGRGAPLAVRLSGSVIALGASAFAAGAMQFVCRNESFAHLFLWHILPVVVIAGLGTFLGRRFKV